MKSITQVMQNLVKPYIDNKDKAYAANIAPVETSPATSAHTAGTQLIYNGVLYDVTADIAINDDLATEGAGANISAADKITEQISSVNEALTKEVSARSQLGAHNLLVNNVKNQVSADVTFIVNSDKSISMSGTSNAAATVDLSDLYPIDAPNNSLILNSGLVDSDIGIILYLYDSSKTYLREYVSYGTDVTIAVSADAKYCKGRIYIKKAGVATSSKTLKPLLRLASDQNELYTPYAKTNQQLTDDAQKALDEIETMAQLGAHNFFAGSFSSYSNNGLDITANSDGTVSVSGTTETGVGENIDSTLFVLKAGTYKFGKNPKAGTSNGDTNMTIFNSGGNHISPLPLSPDEEKTFTLAQDTSVKVRLYCYCTVAGTSFNVTFKPLIRLATDPSDVYTPYAKSNRELTEDLSGTNLLAEIKQLTVTFEESDTIGTQLGRLYTAFTNYCATLDDDDFIIPWALTIAGYEPLIYQGSGMYTKASSAINALFISFALGASNMNIYRACVRSASPYLQNFTQSGSTSSLTALTDDARTSGQNMSLLVYRYKKV